MTSPAPRLYPANGLQLTVRLTQNGQNAAVVLGAMGANPGADGQAFGTAWLAKFWTNFQPRVVSGINVQGATLRVVSSAAGTTWEIPPPASASGTLTGVSALAASSAVIRWNTATGGRSGRGRSYIPGLAVGDIDGGGRNLTSGTLNAFSSAANAYLGNWGTGGVLSSFSPAVLSFTKGAAYPITSSSVLSVVGIQRRRMRG